MKSVGLLQLISEGPGFHTTHLQVHMCINKCKYIHTSELVRSSMQGNKEAIVNTNMLTVLGQWKLRSTMGMSWENWGPTHFLKIHFNGVLILLMQVKVPNRVLIEFLHKLCLFDIHKNLFLSIHKQECLLYRTLEHRTAESVDKVSQKLVKNTF